MEKEMKLLGILALVFALILVVPFALALSPSGASVTVSESNASQTAPADLAGNTSAYAGNITQMDVKGFTTTQSWQGYFGNVSGVIQLADNNDNVMYNWSAADPRGEIYSSTNQTIVWNNIMCFNFTSIGTYDAGDAGHGGNVSLYGTNLTQIEEQYGINSSRDMDSVNRTFSLSGAGTHDMFYTASQIFPEGQCQSTRLYSDGGQVNDDFEEVLLYEPTTTSTVFMSMLESDLAGFDHNSHDFQMIVLDNGHGVDISPTTYYFFVELE